MEYINDYYELSLIINVIRPWLIMLILVGILTIDICILLIIGQDRR